eukprot:scaffold2193_cov74-Phaeocystis_antarctica.AAC.6
MLTLACPASIRIGLDPGGSLTLSRAAPGHVKPLLGHFSGDVEPVGAQKPNSTGVHSSALVRLVKLEYEPPGHSRPAAAPSSQYEPAVQGLHVSSPFFSWKVPAAH